LAEYRAYDRTVRTAATALIALATIYAAAEFGTEAGFVASVIGSTALTALLIGGFCLARSHGKLQWQIDVLEFEMQSRPQGDQGRMTIEELEDERVLKEWPVSEFVYRYAGLLLVPFAGFLVLLYIWTAALDDSVGGEVVSIRPAFVWGSVLFDANSSVLQPPYLEWLRTSARRMSSCSRVVLRAYASDDGSDVHNLRLSEARNEAIVTELESHGVERNRIQAVAFGEGTAREPRRAYFDRRVDLFAADDGAAECSAAPSMPALRSPSVTDGR
jgi:flagellar motor protein MotB